MLKQFPDQKLAQLETENASLRQRVEELQLVERDLRETEARYALAMKGANEGLWDWDPVSKELFLSARLLTTIGMGKETLRTTSNEWLSWVHEEDREMYQRVLSRHLKGETEYFDCEYRVRNIRGGYVWVLAHGLALRNEDNVACRMVGSIGDITERKNYERELLHRANYDSLTGLPNRLLAMNRLTQSLARARRNHSVVGILFVDLDNFKKINDTLGHDIGDNHLKQISDRLYGCVRDMDTVARFGGDEFLVIIPDLACIDELKPVCQRILSATSQPVMINGYEFFTSASIGVSIYPNDGDEPNDLVRNADSAMYEAKRTGRDTFSYFTPEMNQELVKRLTMESHLRHALERGQLSLHYQSIINVYSKKVIGAEALLRWHCPEYGQVSPDVFIPLAEESGLIVTFGDWVLEEACQQAVRWREQTGEDLHIAVNVAFPQFRDGHLVKTVQRVLQQTGLPPASLELELTERLLMEDERGCAQALSELHGMGVKLSIDDFGTGYSALSYLKRFPVNTLKIDRSFVSDITTSPENTALISAIIRMAHALGLSVVGEGVESEEQFDFLHSQQCDCVQGYYFSKPIPPEEFTPLLLCTTPYPCS
ncbi:MAG: putative bifunctional diguanylate cyclase/phosphodiesterase [Pontibacterium sp.]